MRLNAAEETRKFGFVDDGERPPDVGRVVEGCLADGADVVCTEAERALSMSSATLVDDEDNEDGVVVHAFLFEQKWN